MKFLFLGSVFVLATGFWGCAKKSRSEAPRAGAPGDAIHRGGLEGAQRATGAMPPGHPPITGAPRAVPSAAGEGHEGHEHDSPTEKLPPVIIDGKRGDATQGKRLFAQLCATCHGEGGAGGGIMASGNLTDAVWQAERSDQQIGVVISHGKPNTKMPGFADKMDLQKLNDLVAHIRSLKR